ncbi:Crp/Fnr family transcriptional regulator [Pontibacter oryzae]|uniref:Crp/Fnr family transcriptional regulator n=1 Tax=Pontibacter oryzae TaxID=2304593 RepID=A0A399SKX5_9BACT|nr:Crp/Fnr family transcriptional regulator [Pontibacter oryzae]RIJ42425.1 Crp/Fnr family transcriptional regulator [Pontibacter oryzae]
MDYTTQANIQQLFPQFEEPLLQELIQESTIRGFNEGEQIIRTGQYMRSSLLLLSGLMKIYREDEEGNEFMMYYLEPGNACAMSMMCTARNEKSQVMAKAVQAAEAILVPQHLTEQWLGKYKSWHNFVIGSYRQRFEELLLTLDSIAFKAMDERLVFYLRRHLQNQGSEVRLSHQQIADDLNSSREVISRLLKKLEQRQALTLHRSHLEILNLDAL